MSEECKHMFLYEDPDFEHMRCFDCDAPVEPDDDDD